jgi:hypothetical protein
MLLCNKSRKTKMTQHELHTEHDRIALSVPEVTQLTEHERAAHLGSYMLHDIENGDFIPVTARHAFEADFDAIDVLDSQSLKEKYQAFTHDLAADDNREKLRGALENLSPREKEVFTAALFATEVARDFFTNKNVDKKTRDENGWTVLDPEREDSYHLKKLSETADAGLCVEYSLFVGKVMKDIGEPMTYTVGYRQDWSDEDGIYHAMLTADEGHLLVDPLLIAQTHQSSVPMGLYRAEAEGMVKDTEGQQVYTDIVARSKNYSASPIPAAETQW